MIFVVGGGGSGKLKNTDAVLIVTVPTGSTVTATKGGTTLTPTMWVKAADNTLDCAIFIIPASQFDSTTPWTITATDGTNTASDTVLITTNKEYEVVLNFLVPAAYQAVEFIQANGTQYINTGVPARVQIRCEIDAQSVTTNPSDQTLLGGNGTGTQNDVVVIGYNHASSFKSYYYYIQSVFDDIKNIADTNRHSFVVNFESGNLQFIVDGVVEKQATSTFTATTSSTTLHLFRRANGNNPFYGRLYALRIYDYLDGGKMIREFIPCYRRADSTAGLWDRVGEQFYTNAGTGAFIVGPDVN